ncbi:hypothetical protein [Cyanobacterium sp. Dongsha4]|uniref:hypothetical protein n=1 Tax=Cyanobacterium sp. DS4 TaxID=2878255 RepID=UPI002E802754|nr:hypothetical protein [Cyanobacterium sp. Dongsha4]WVL00369.1 hypothetical protein Dongsha4_17225 [Cyanobacterium sp. Dongsha4]
MELIICFLAVISAFTALIVSVVGLINAPTPILLAILVAGMMLTQKSINKFTEPTVNFTEEKEKNRIEKVELNSSENGEEKTVQSMIYRGSNYSRNSTLDKLFSFKNKGVTQYRGAKINHNEKEVV